MNNGMQMSIVRETSFNISGSLTLAAMREIVENTKQLSGDSRVDVRTYDDQRERTSTTTVKVHGA